MRTTRPLLLALAALHLLAASGASAQSLGEIARKNREKKKEGGTAKRIENESIERPVFDFYPSVKASFAVPKGWAKPTTSKEYVSSPCPGVERNLDGGRGLEGERCILVVAVDGPLSARRGADPPAMTVKGLREEIEKKAKTILEPWRGREIGGLPGGELVFDGDKPARRARFVLLYDSQTRVVYMMALMAVPEVFDTFAPALDTVIATFAPESKTDAGKPN